MAPNQQKIIGVEQGNTPIPDDQWSKVRVSGTGMPVWETIRDSAGLEVTEAGPMVAVVMKISDQGIEGSRFVAAGTGNFSVPLSRVNKEASRKAKILIAFDLMDFKWPDNGEVRNFSGWLDLKDDPNTKIQNGTAVDQAWWEQLPGLLCRLVLLPGTDFKVYITVQLIPRSEDVLKESLANENGEDTDVNCPGIPCINFTGADTGLGGGVASLVPRVSQSLGAGSGCGVLPMILGSGGVEVQVPPLAHVKFELFSFMRSVLKPISLKDVKEWEGVFLSDEPWEYPAVPNLIWPEPDPVTQRVDNGEDQFFLKYSTGV